MALDDTYTPPAAVAKAGWKARESDSRRASGHDLVDSDGRPAGEPGLDFDPDSSPDAFLPVRHRGQTRFHVERKGKGWQAWHGWGGDAGARWAASILRKL